MHRETYKLGLQIHEFGGIRRICDHGKNKYSCGECKALKVCEHKNKEWQCGICLKLRAVMKKINGPLKRKAMLEGKDPELEQMRKELDIAIKRQKLSTSINVIVPKITQNCSNLCDIRVYDDYIVYEGMSKDKYENMLTEIHDIINGTITA